MSWVPLALLTLVVGLMLAMPLIRKIRPARPREEYELQVYRDQLRELGEDKARGLLTPEQEEAARLEIDRRLLGASKGRYRLPGTLPMWQTAAILAVAVPAVSLGLYFWLGAPGTPDQPLATRTDLVQPRESPELLALFAEQEAAVAEDPENPNVWVQFGRALLVMGRFSESADAFRQAIALGDAGADVQTELVEALLNEAGGTITPAARQAIDAAIAVDPEHPAARYYLGLERAQAGLVQEAFDVWLALAADTPADAPWLPLVRARLDGAADELGIDLAEVMPAPAAPAAPDRGIADMTPEQQMEMIAGMVDGLAARLEGNPDDPEGWARLAQSYRVLGRMDEASAAVARAAELRPDDVSVLLQQAAILMDGAAAVGEPYPALARTNLERALEIEPRNAEGLYFAGLVAEGDGDRTAAIGYWQRLLDLLNPGGDAYREVAARIESLREG